MPRDAFDLRLDLAHGLDPVAFAEDRLGFVPDPWQAGLMRSNSRQIIENITRQGGKSTSAAAKALHVALYDAPALVPLVSPSQRQSRELFAKVIEFMRQLEPAEATEEDNKLSVTLRPKRFKERFCLDTHRDFAHILMGSLLAHFIMRLFECRDQSYG